LENRLEHTVKQLPPSKQPKRDWERQRKDLLNALADAGMSVSGAARNLYMSRNTVVYQINRVRREGFEPLNFYQLAEMLGYVKKEDSDESTVP
jgi:transcriptional regulator with GAF, ATPase, and Fis domain